MEFIDEKFSHDLIIWEKKFESKVFLIFNFFVLFFLCANNSTVLIKLEKTGRIKSQCQWMSAKTLLLQRNAAFCEVKGVNFLSRNGKKANLVLCCGVKPVELLKKKKKKVTVTAFSKLALFWKVAF